MRATASQEHDEYCDREGALRHDIDNRDHDSAPASMGNPLQVASAGVARHGLYADVPDPERGGISGRYAVKGADVDVPDGSANGTICAARKGFVHQAPTMRRVDPGDPCGREPIGEGARDESWPAADIHDV